MISFLKNHCALYMVLAAVKKNLFVHPKAADSPQGWVGQKGSMRSLFKSRINLAHYMERQIAP